MKINGRGIVAAVLVSTGVLALSGCGTGDVCTSTEELCSCEVELGCFVSCPCQDKCGYCLPYLTSLGDDKWWSGIAFTNASSVPANATIEFRCDGKSKLVYQAVPANGVASVGVNSFKDELIAAGFNEDSSLFATVRGVDHVLVIMGNDFQAYGYLAKYPNAKLFNVDGGTGWGADLCRYRDCGNN